MRAMILAAGHGERMRPLTDHIPKPLLKVGNKPLIQHQIEALRRAEVSDIIINIARLGEQIEQYLGDGRQFGVTLTYSNEGQTPLETAGGIIKVLDFFQGQAFIVANSDIYTDFDYTKLAIAPDEDAHLVLVPNPKHHPDGDFVLQDGRITTEGEPRFTFSGIGVYNPGLFKDMAQGHQKLAPLLISAASRGRVSGQLFKGYWNDVGTPQRLEQVNAQDASHNK